MSAEYAIQLECPVRRGESEDLVEATALLRQQIKASSMLEIMKSIAKKEGKLPFEITLQHRVQSGNGVETRELDYQTVRKQVDGFAAKCGPCAECPANLLGRDFGCSGALKYPITENVERWIADRIQLPDTVGGLFLASAVEDLGYDGAPLASWRVREDLFERRTAVVRPQPDGTRSASTKSFTRCSRWGLS